MKRAFFFFLLVAPLSAETTKTVYNPFTQKLDYITELTSGTLPSGTSWYVQVGPSGTQSGAFNIASGTVSGPFTVNDNSSGLAQLTLEALSPGNNNLRVRIIDVGEIQGYFGFNNASPAKFSWWDASPTSLMHLTLSSGTLKVEHNVTAASMTLTGLTGKSCIGTAANGDVQAGTCGYAVEPATVTFNLNKGLTASTATITDATISNNLTVTKNVTASTAVFNTWVNMPNNAQLYFGTSNNAYLQWNTTLGLLYGSLPSNALGLLWSNNSRTRILADNNMTAAAGAALLEISNDDTNRPDFTAANWTGGASGNGIFQDIYGDYFTGHHINIAAQANGAKGYVNGIHAPNAHGIFQVVDSTNAVAQIIYQAGTGDPSQNLIDIRAGTSWTTGNPSGSFSGKYINLVNASTTMFTIASDGSLYSASSVTLAGMAAPASPADGTIWNDSTQKGFIATVAGATQTLQGTLFTVIADSVVANTTTETNLIGANGQNLMGVSNLPANFFTPGKTVHLVARGYFSVAAAGENLTLKLYLGSTTLATFGPVSLTTLSSATITIDGIITCRTAGGSGTVMTQAQIPVGVANVTAYTLYANTTTTATVDTTAAQQLRVAVTHGTANADNKFTITNGYAEVIN